MLNAGILVVGTIEQKSAKSQQDQIDTNMYHVVMLAKMLLPKLKERKSGAFIVNSSSSYLKCFPGSVVYSASKAFLTQWTEGIAFELRHSNIDVQCLCPNGTRTNIIKHDAFGYVATPVEKVVAACNRQLGRSKDDVLCFGTPFNEISTNIVFVGVG